MKKKRFSIGLAGILMGSAMVVSNFHTPASLCIEQKTFETALETPVATDDADLQNSFDPSEVSIEDSKLFQTTLVNYGEGCILVTLRKDTTADMNEDPTTDGEFDADNAEEIEPTEEPIETSDPLDEETSQESVIMKNTGISSKVELIDACLTEEEKAAVAAGSTKEIKVTFHYAKEDEIKRRKLEELATAMDDYMLATTGLTFCNYLNITIEKQDETTGEWKKIKKLKQQVEVAVDILEDYRTDQGNFCVIAPVGKTFEMREDTDKYSETFTINIDGSGYYVLCHQDEITQSAQTMKPVKHSNYFQKLVEEDLCLWHWFMCAFFIIGITWVAAINAKKKRLVFMIVVDVLLLVCALIGRCLYDFIFLVVFAFLLFLVFVWKTKSMQKKRSGKR